MALPSWEDPKLGTMKRAALWLATVVQEGNIFTLADLRDAFPEVSQIDRRMRDLRDQDWRIDTHREDSSLDNSERRFVAQGVPVWEPGKARSKEAQVLTATRRREVMSRDGNLCRSCGITPGQEYAGSYETAQLDIARKEVRYADGTKAVELVTECRRCRVGGRGVETDDSKTLAALGRLGIMERRMLASWIEADEREFGTVELLWAEYRTLPEESRARFRAALGPETL
ncbi:hypothetical protein GCM10009760_21510 [Kitasatospora kazusensis]|uniref:Uncharacterized protein n=1 Tax=Kitasatospora kazusensis TaxID=407974 RepID=A0ABN2ZAM0_9ACTN